MLKKISRTALKVISVIIVLLHLCILFIPVFILGILKLIPNRHWQLVCTKGIDAIASWWIYVNSVLLDLSQNIKWEITEDSQLSRHNWYLVLANHQSWVDIVVLQKVFLGKIPSLKFFIKDNLKWIPLLGFAWWALDLPFMKRYSSAYLKLHPEKIGRDIAATRKACEKFKNRPAALTNFVEGTRFNATKHQQQQSPYTMLLKPRAGGIAHVLSSIGDQLTHILDVTIVYPQGKKKFWDLVCGRINLIKVNIREISLPAEINLHRYAEDTTTRNQFHHWINQVWHEKDHILMRLLDK